VTASGFGADRFGWTDDALAELRALRGWTEPAIERLELTYDASSGLVGIPIRDEILDELGRLTYDPHPGRPNGRPKMQGPAGVPRQLFPPPEALAGDVREVLLTEGEPDEVAALSAGFVAVGVPGTAGWHPGYAARFRGPRWTVYVVFDCDEPGRRAAAEVAASLLEAGVDVRVVDLDPSRQDGYDLTDYLLERGGGALRELMDASELYSTEPPGPEIVIEAVRGFVERQLPPAESLVGVARGGTNLLPRYGWVMPWGREGCGKTSVVLDLLFHAAAGLKWAGWPVARPLRLVLIVNEGVPGGFQDKVATKLEAWQGDRDAVLDNIAVYVSPWGEFTFRSERMVAYARDYALDFGADYVAFDPLHTLGTFGAGTPDETETFKHVLRAFGLWDDLGVLTSHHSNKAGMVSGDWARHPDTVLHLEKDGKNAATKVTLEKARPADPAELGNPFLLEWVVDTFGYTRKSLDALEPRTSDDELLAEVEGELDRRQGAPVGMTDLLAAVGHDANRVRALVKGALEAPGTTRIRNLGTSKNAFSLVVDGQKVIDGIDEPAEEAQTRMDTGATSDDFEPSDDLGAERVVVVNGPRTPEGSIDETIDNNDGIVELDEDDPWT
jgi:hypothetical protein